MKINKKIIVIFLISLSLLGWFFYFLPLPNLPLNKGEEQGGGLIISFPDTIPGSISVYDFMSKLQGEGKINFTEKNYPGMGKLITAINGIKNNGEQNWIYYVNGVEANVGVSNYKINLGDVISWKYEKSNF